MPLQTLRRMLRHAVVAVLWIQASAAVTFAQQAEVKRPDPARFDDEIQAFEAWDRQNSVPRDAVLFVGSSSIRLWPTAESFADLAVINRGFGGSHTADVTHFAQRIVLQYTPLRIVFYAGDNDIAGGIPPETVYDDFKAFVELVHQRLPTTQIIFLPIKPSLARWALWPKMQVVNERVRQLAESDDRLDYVDTATPMLGADGRPRPELFREDGLHLNSEGYRLWTRVLAPALTSVKDDR